MRFRKTKEHEALLADPVFREEYLNYERENRMRTGRVGCLLVIALMPAGVVLDLADYPDKWDKFLLLRVLCSILMGGVLMLHLHPLGKRHFRLLQHLILLLPAFCINLMILWAKEPDSPYYAGLNLLLLAISAVAHWRLADSVTAVFSILLMYLGFEYSFTHTGRHFVNNVYFMALTGIIVVFGNVVFNRVVFQEFVSQFQLKQSKKELEQKNLEIAEKNGELVEMDKVKNQFFGNVSHELRTPLTLLLAPLQGLLNDPNRRWDEQTRSWLQLMHDKALQLLKLINDLLALQRLDSGKMTVLREPLALPEFVQKLGESVHPVAQNKHVQLTAYCDPGVPVILTDREKLEQILVNLLFNAVKFTPAGGRITLRVEADKERLRLEVTDTGVGIERERLQYLGTRFWQADGSSSRKYQGVGIGLALVKELVEVQGGELHVDSELGKGTTFVIHLPLILPSAGTAAPLDLLLPIKPQPEPAEAPNVEDQEWLVALYRQAQFSAPLNPIESSMRPFETPGRSDRPKLLIADDEPDVLRFLASLFGDEYAVIEATDGQQALDKTAQMLPDAIVCDWMMPEKDGLQVCREIRERISTKEIPILLLTARGDEETKLQGLAAGASDFLTKPFSPTELRLRVRHLTRLYLLQRQLRRANQELESTNDDLQSTNRELELSNRKLEESNQNLAAALDRLGSAQAELVKKEKMASLGRLSAGIMHEINNPLNFIKTGLFVLRSKSRHLSGTEQNEFAETVRDMDDGLNRVQNIIQGVRHFAHPNNSMEQEVPVSEIVRTSLVFLSHDLKGGVKVEQQLAPDHCVRGNRNQLVQVLLNLLQNSIHAVGHPARAQADAPPTIWIESHADPGWDRIVVRDNGPGIPSEDLDKVFDPFFTTKQVGEGTGLGLSICHGIIAGHQGRISVRSEAGRFCEFTIELPHLNNGN